MIDICIHVYDYMTICWVYCYKCMCYNKVNTYSLSYMYTYVYAVLYN